MSHPTVALYGGCTYERAMDIIWDHRLRHCEPAPLLVTGIWFEQEKDLLMFKLEVGEVIKIEDDFVIVGPDQRETAEAFISYYCLESRIAKADLLAVRFWDIGDRQAFEEELDLIRDRMWNSTGD